MKIGNLFPTIKVNKKYVYGGLLVIGLYLHGKLNRLQQLGKNIEILEKERLSFMLKKESNPILKELGLMDPIPDHKSRVIILGGGLIGISSAYQLLKTGKFEVLLLDADSENALKEDSFTESAILTSRCYSMIDTSFTRNILGSIFGIQSNSLKFHFSFLREKFVKLFLFNSFGSSNKYYQHKNNSNCSKLGKLSMEEYFKFLQDLDSSNKIPQFTPHIFWHEKSTPINIRIQKKKIISILPEIKFENINDSKELTKKFGFLNSNILGSGYILKKDYLVHSLKFSKELFEICKKNPDFKYLSSTEYKKFFLNESADLQAIETNYGIIIADHFVIASGCKSKDLLWKFGIKLPSTNYITHSTKFVSPSGTFSSENLILTDEEFGITHSKIGSEYYLVGMMDFMSENSEPIESRIKNLKESIFKFYNPSELPSNWENIKFFSIQKSMSADDAPIIGPIQRNFKNLYLNTGHGSKELLYAMGSAKLLSSCIANEEMKDFSKKEFLITRFNFI